MRKKLFLLLILMLCVLPLVWTDMVVIKETSGKVETRPPGGAAWSAVSAGQSIDVGATISTGFNSTAVIDLNNSFLEVEPLTRMTVEDLLQEEGTVTTKVFLKVGKVKATVESAEGLTHDFTLRNPTMTASVRGTELVVEEFSIECLDGRIVVTFSSGRESLVFGGESSGGESAYVSSYTVSPYTASDAEVEPPSEDGQENATTGTIKIIY